MTIPHNNYLSDFTDFILKVMGRGGSEIESRADTFKTISRHILVDTNWAHTENIYRIFTKILCLVCARVCCHQHPDTNEPEKITKVKIRAFNYSIGIHQNDFTGKKLYAGRGEILWSKSRHWCILRSYYKFSCISLTVVFPSMVYATPFLLLFIYLLVGISCRSGVVLRLWKSIITYFMATIQKIIYILLSSFLNSSLTGIGSDQKLPPLLILFTIL